MGNDNATLKTTKLEKVILPTRPQDFAKSAAAAGLKEYDYFTQVLAVDIWPKILSYVTNKMDLESVMNTCQLFHDILEPRAFTELILPLLLLTKTIPPESALACRGINQTAKSTVENVLFGVSPWFYPDSLWFKDLGQFIKERLPKLPFNVSPFIWNRAALRASKPEHFPNILILSKNYGTNLTELHLAIDMPRDLHAQLLQILCNIPKIRHLNLRLHFRNFAQNEKHPVDPVSASIFPMLNNLSDLTIDFNQDYNLSLYPSPQFSKATPVVTVFMKNFFQTYGPQLDSFSCNRALLSMGLSQDFLNSTLLNIKKFQLINKPFNETFDTISQFKFPKLERLSFRRKFEHENIPFSPSFLRMLGNFGGSLQELYCEGLEAILMGDQIAVAVGNWKPLVKLTKLTVYWKCFDGDMWSALQVILPNLRCLRFQPNLCREEAPVPAFNRRQAYFKMFPQLEKLIWCVYGREMSFIEKTFVRKIQLPVCKCYEVPILA